jgi:hypothetical protein
VQHSTQANPEIWKGSVLLTVAGYILQKPKVAVAGIIAMAGHTLWSVGVGITKSLTEKGSREALSNEVKEFQ